MKNIRKVKIIFIVSIVVAIFAAGVIGFLVGRNGLQIANKTILNESADLNNKDFQLFWDAYTRLKETYLGTVDPQKYLYDAIAGGYSSVGDPYTVFLPPDLSAEFSRELSGELEGIGIKIGMLDGYPAVIAPLEGSPAQKAGLKPKDLILKVDDTETQGLALDLVVAKIRGKEGTTVKLEVVRQDESKPRTFEITRAKLSVKTVEVSYLDDVALLTINEFGLDTKGEYEKAVKEITDKNISKIVLDLRNNPGGLLDGPIDVANELFPQDTTIVIEESKTGRNEMKTNGMGSLKQTKLAVLVNGGTASSAEILAGAVKDHNRGKIIGEKTFGKGTVQELGELRSGSSAKITVAKWLTPNGSSIDKNGITPDIEMKEPDNILFDTNDPLVQRAIQELK